MTQTAEERKKAAQALLITEFPAICRYYILRLLLAHLDTRYAPIEYLAYVNETVFAIFRKFKMYKEEWKLGMESELEEIWNTELAKEKEEIIKNVRVQIQIHGKDLVKSLCQKLTYPDFTEERFSEVVLLATIHTPKYQRSWKEELRETAASAWVAEVQAAKDDGRIPSSLWDAFQNAWEHMVITDPFANHDKITLPGIYYTLVNLVMLYPKKLWDTWTDKVKYEDVIKNIPVNLHDKIFHLQDKINARRSRS